MNTALTISILFSVICLFVAFLYFVGYMGERHINNQLREALDGEADRNYESYESGIRTGQLYAELGVSYIGDRCVKADRCDTQGSWTGSSYGALDDFFTGTTPADFPTLKRTAPADFPRPMGVLPVPHDAA